MINILSLITAAITNKVDSLSFYVNEKESSIYLTTTSGIEKIDKDYSLEYMQDVLKHIGEFFNIKKDFVKSKTNHIKTIELHDIDYEISSHLNFKNENEYDIILKIKSVEEKYFNKINKSNPYYVLFDDMVRHALENKLTDIIITVSENTSSTNGETNIKFNLSKNNYKTLSEKEGYSFCKTIFNVMNNKNLDSNETDNFMNCFSKSIDYPVEDDSVKISYTSNKIYPAGFVAVIRVLPLHKEDKSILLDRLGYTDQQKEQLKSIVANGSMIIAGVNGSGKSTTLKNLYFYANEKISNDVIFIDEVRDKKTFNTIKEKILAGNTILTNMHATSALEIIDKLIDFGATTSDLGESNFLSGVSYQKLFKKICPHCCIDFNMLISSGKASEKDVDIYKNINKSVNSLKHPLKKRNPEGCIECHWIGGQGYEICAEIITLDPKMLELIRQEKSLQMYWKSLSDKNPISENMKGKTWKEQVLQRVITGQLSVCDLEKL